MPENINTTTLSISRRRALFAAAALSAGAVAPAATAALDEPDAELLRLEAEFHAAKKHWDAEEESSDASFQTLNDIADAMLVIPAVSLTGVLAKVRLGKWFEDGDEERMAEMIESVTADIERMAAGGVS